MTIPAPFAFQVVEGWNRSAAQRIVDLHASGLVSEHERRGDGHVVYGSDRVPILEIEKRVVDADRSLPTETLLERAVSILRTALSRTDEEHMERMHVAARALDAAARLAAPDVLPSRKMNATSASPVVAHAFGEVETTSSGWTASMRADPQGRRLPSIVTLFQSCGMVELARLDTRIHDVEPLDAIERLRLEARLAGLIARADTIEGTDR